MRVLLIIPLLLLSCQKAPDSPSDVAKPEVRKVEDGQLGYDPRDGLLRVHGESKPFTGISVARYPGGKVKFERGFEAGRMHGPSLYYDEAGELEREETWESGEMTASVFKGRLGERLEGIREGRQRLNKTVWATEEAAQAREETFIKFWDDLRKATDKWAVLERFQFSQLQLEQAQPPKTMDWDITRTAFSGTGVKVLAADWSGFLEALKTDGVKVVETEWHQETFEAARDESPAKSVFKFVIHAMRGTEERHIIRGQLAIDWTTEKDRHGHFIPGAIAVRNLRILSRKGIPPFSEESVVEPAKERAFGPPAPTDQQVITHDLDGDGLSEILLPGSNLIYRNRGGFRFEKAKLLLHPPDTLMGSVLADFTGDGTVDLLVMVSGRPPVLYEGTPDGRFPTPPRPLTAGEPAQGFSYGCAVGDIDGDADLDVWVTQYKPPYVGGQFPSPYYDSNDGWPSYLLKNDGKGGFTDATAGSGLEARRHRRTYSSSFVDLNGDRHLDLITVNDFAGLDVYHNDGRGRFRDVTAKLGETRHSFGMSHALADFDGDGALDLYMTGMGSTTARRLEAMGAGREDFATHNAKRMPLGYGNRLLLGGESLQQAPFNEQLARTGWSWGCAALDVDNDGDRDLYVANGNISSESCRDHCTVFWRHEIHEAGSKENRDFRLFYTQDHLKFSQVSWNGFEHNVLFLNTGGKSYVSVAFLLGLSHEFDSRNIISDDLDGDGRPDLLVGEQRWPAGRVKLPRRFLHVLRNRWPGGNHWIGARLRGAKGVPVVGAVVTLERADGRIERLPVVTGDSFASQHAFTKHFGLGEANKATALEVRWPNGKVTRLEKPSVDRYHQMKPPTGSD